ncbi:hypothetical protein C1645_739900 [Glomus cerebriforme]|uniref:CCHC-type domain-containing protein n=1 Tax=Glomus cerebriforme TaxID=658196 RepID=A0A397SUJ6_9GLOM|nr:hypothetical protein C1645_739900 [Glomus cerebriforme]
MADNNNLNLVNPDYYIVSPISPPGQLEAIVQQAKALQASAEAQNKLIMALQTQISLPRSNQNVTYTAENVVLNKHTNWFVPTRPQQKPCFVCHYYGHIFENCPNIHSNAYNRCIRCWQHDHTFQNCQLPKEQTVRPPFKNNFLYPNELLHRTF